MDNFKDALLNSIGQATEPMLNSLGNIVAQYLPIILVLALVEVAILIFKHLSGETDRNIRAAMMDDYDFEAGDEIDWDELEDIAGSYFYYDLETGEYLDYDEEDDEE